MCQIRHNVIYCVFKIVACNMSHSIAESLQNIFFFIFGTIRGIKKRKNTCRGSGERIVRVHTEKHIDRPSFPPVGTGIRKCALKCSHHFSPSVLRTPGYFNRTVLLVSICCAEGPRSRYSPLCKVQIFTFILGNRLSELQTLS